MIYIKVFKFLIIELEILDKTKKLNYKSSNTGIAKANNKISDNITKLIEYPEVDSTTTNPTKTFSSLCLKFDLNSTWEITEEKKEKIIQQANENKNKPFKLEIKSNIVSKPSKNKINIDSLKSKIEKLKVKNENKVKLDEYVYKTLKSNTNNTITNTTNINNITNNNTNNNTNSTTIKETNTYSLTNSKKHVIKTINFDEFKSKKQKVVENKIKPQKQLIAKNKKIDLISYNDIENTDSSSYSKTRSLAAEFFI